MQKVIKSAHYIENNKIACSLQKKYIPVFYIITLTVHNKALIKLDFLL
jgi:hypothetical protein